MLLGFPVMFESVALQIEKLQSPNGPARALQEEIPPLLLAHLSTEDYRQIKDWVGQVSF